MRFYLVQGLTLGETFGRTMFASNWHLT